MRMPAIIFIIMILGFAEYIARLNEETDVAMEQERRIADRNRAYYYHQLEQKKYIPIIDSKGREEVSPESVEPAVKFLKELDKDRFVFCSAENMRHAYQLDLSGTSITDEDLKEILPLKYLVILKLTDTTISDEGLKELTSLKYLHHLILDRTLITGEGLKALKDSHPELIVRTGSGR